VARSADEYASRYSSPARSSEFEPCNDGACDVPSLLAWTSSTVCQIGPASRPERSDDINPAGHPAEGLGSRCTQRSTQ
jgi:hypothetical protein